jgi:AbrB family looped-hinge helix DNA binding protein
MLTSTVTSKGQVTIPAKIRRRAGIQPTDRVVFKTDKNSVVIEKIPNVRAVFGSFANPKVKPLSAEEINRLVNSGLFGKKK